MTKNERIDENANRLDTVGRDMEDLLGRVTELEGTTEREEGPYHLVNAVTNEELVISKEVWAWITRRDLDWNAQVLLGKEILKLEKKEVEDLEKKLATVEPLGREKEKLDILAHEARYKHGMHKPFFDSIQNNEHRKAPTAQEFIDSASALLGELSWKLEDGQVCADDLDHDQVTRLSKLLLDK